MRYYTGGMYRGDRSGNMYKVFRVRSSGLAHAKIVEVGERGGITDRVGKKVSLSKYAGVSLVKPKCVFETEAS